MKTITNMLCITFFTSFAVFLRCLLIVGGSFGWYESRLREIVDRISDKWRRKRRRWRWWWWWWWWRLWKEKDDFHLIHSQFGTWENESSCSMEERRREIYKRKSEKSKEREKKRAKKRESHSKPVVTNSRQAWKHRYHIFLSHSISSFGHGRVTFDWELHFHPLFSSSHLISANFEGEYDGVCWSANVESENVEMVVVTTPDLFVVDSVVSKKQLNWGF